MKARTCPECEKGTMSEKKIIQMIMVKGKPGSETTVFYVCDLCGHKIQKSSNLTVMEV